MSGSPAIFPTYGVHNPPEYSPCATPDCLYRRGPGEPSDPLYPEYWTAHWTMYRVYEGYQEHPPPYDGEPPSGTAYQASHGSTYYDSTWRGPNGEVGAMMEHYVEWSLPIFPRPNNYTSSFVSLGDTGYFLTYDDRPEGMPPICLFSPLNHPPTRDFIKHLPYSEGDSARLDHRIQGYSFWTSPDPKEPPIQVGVAPDRTADGAIMFGYSFETEYRPDDVDEHAEPYRHPHSFYFSGFPGTPPDAPIVSQIYDEFTMTRPDPAQTWDLVYERLTELDGSDLPACDLFGRNSAAGATASALEVHPTWARDRA